MNVERVRTSFGENGLDCEIGTFDPRRKNVEPAPRACGLEREVTATPLTFKGKDKDMLVGMNGNALVCTKMFKPQFQIKAKMMSVDEVREAMNSPYN